MYATRKEHRITGLSLWGAAAVLIPKVSNFERNSRSIHSESVGFLRVRMGGRMSLDTAKGRHKEYVGRAEHCLKMAKIA